MNPPKHPQKGWGTFFPRPLPWICPRLLHLYCKHKRGCEVVRGSRGQAAFKTDMGKPLDCCKKWQQLPTNRKTPLTYLIGFPQAHRAIHHREPRGG